MLVTWPTWLVSALRVKVSTRDLPGDAEVKARLKVKRAKKLICYQESFVHVLKVKTMQTRGLGNNN
jgi:hypothetical protein